MNQLQSARLANAKAVLRIMEEYPHHWSNRSSIQVKLDRIRTLVTTLDTGEFNQRNADSKGYTGHKKESAAALRALTCEVATKLKDWAVENHDPVLYEAVKFTPSELLGMSFTSQVAISKMALSKAKEVVSKMEGYDISPESLRSFEEGIKLTEAINMDRTVVQSLQLQATHQLETNSKALNITLRSLDQLMTGFNDEKDADFVSAYHNVRGQFRQRPSRAANRNQPKKEVPKA